MHQWTLGAVVVVAAALAGCATPDQLHDSEFRRKKAETERDAAQQSLKDEHAKVLALETRLVASNRATESAKAELNAYKERVDELEKSQAELRTVVEERARKPLERPTAVVSPLPAATDQALQAFAEKYTGRVGYDRTRGAVSFANDRLFDTGSDAVRTDAFAGLTELAGILAATPANEYEVIVVGHTDDLPITRSDTLTKHPSNWHLSVHRAIAVKDVLVKAGLPPARLGIMGYAEFRPLGSDPVRNRRVEVFLARFGEVQPLAPVKPR